MMNNIFKTLLLAGALIFTFVPLQAQDTSEKINQFAFSYKYDKRNRQVEKKIPGAEPVFMVYDNRDRLVLVQDANQRVRGQWIFTKYDVLNRPVMTGLITNAGTREQVQAEVDSFYARRKPYSEERNGSMHGYTNVSYPLLQNANQALTVTYYDNYDFLPAWEDAAAFVFRSPLNEELQPSQRVTGNVTGSLTKVLNKQKYLRTVNYYDDRYRPIQVIADNAVNGTDRTTTIYGFTGNVLRSYTMHNDHYGQGAFINVAGINEYDQQLRLKNAIQVLQNPSWKNIHNVQVINPGVVERAPDSPAGEVSWTESEQVTNHIDESAWAEYRFPDMDQTAAAGLSSANTSITGSFSSIHFGFKVTQGQVSILSAGEEISIGQRSRDDIFLITKENGVLNYFRNGDRVHTSSIEASQRFKVVVVLSGDSGYNQAKVLVKIGFGETKLLASHRYNALEQVIEKNLGQLTNGTFLQSLDYRYHIRGWLTSINNPALPGDLSEPKPDLYGLQLSYDQVPSGSQATPQYNGNISSMKWATPQFRQDRPSYDFSYDKLYRLTQAKFKISN